MSYLSALNYKYKHEDSEGTLFVFDTNYFLYAYQSYSNGDSYIKALENKKKDIYVPFITYIEFLSNINSITSSLKSEIKALEHYVNSVDEEVKIFDISAIKLKLKTESFRTKSKNYDQLNNLLKMDIEKLINDYVDVSIIEIEDMIIKIEKILNKKLKEFSESEKNLPMIGEYEKKVSDLTDRIDKLFESDCVVGKIYTQDMINKYIDDMDNRYAKNIPPGFCDEIKGDKEKIFGNLIIPDKAGDLILWKDLINLLQVDVEKKAKFSKIVIVTNDGLSDEKSDWRMKSGKDRVVHDQLKIEFYQKTGKLLDLMKVEDFIEYFSQEDEVTKEHIVNEIKSFKEVQFPKEEKIKFTLFDKLYVLNNQREMMEKIFITVINMKDLSYEDLRELPCISTTREELNTTFNSYTKLFLNQETEILLGTRLNRTDKLRHIHKLFIIAGFDPDQLIFHNRELQITWQKFYQRKEKILYSDEIIVSLEKPESTLGVSVIGDVKFFYLGEEIENNLTDQIKDKLINREFYNEPNEIEFKDVMWDLGYDVENQLIDFDDF